MEKFESQRTPTESLKTFVLPENGVLDTERPLSRLSALGVDTQYVTPLETFSGCDVVEVSQLDGLVHYSSANLQAFRGDAISTGGKFGDNAVYLALGNLKGETFEELAANPEMNKYDVTFSGVILIVPRSEVRPLERKIKDLKSIPQSKIKTTVNNAKLTDLLQNVKCGDRDIHGILIPDESFEFAELVVPNEHVHTLDIE